MKIFIGSDHRGFKLKNKLITWLKSKNYQVIDCGNKVYDPKDDYPDFAFLVAKKVKKEKGLGIVICGSGIGVSIAANRIKAVRCGLGFEPSQIKSACQHDHLNVLALASDYLNFEKAKDLVEIFLKTKPKNQEKYLRRIKKLDQ